MMDFDELRDSGEGFDDIAPVAADPEEGLMSQELDQEIRDALMALPHHYRMAVLMVDLQGLSYQEVADALEVPIGTIMSRLYRGRKKIEHALMSYGKRANYLFGAPRRQRTATTAA